MNWNASLSVFTYWCSNSQGIWTYWREHLDGSKWKVMRWDPTPKGLWEKKDMAEIVLSGTHSNSAETHMKVWSASQEENCTENQCWQHCGHGLWALRTVTKLIYYIYKACSLSYFLWQKGKGIIKFCIFYSWLSTMYVATGIHIYVSCIYLYFYLAHIICSFKRYCCCSCLYSKSFSKKILKSGAFSPE